MFTLHIQACLRTMTNWSWSQYFFRGGRYSKWKIFTGVIHFLSQSDFTKKRVCEIDRYPQLPILHLDYGAKKLLFLVHKNNCIFIGEKLIEVKLRELNKHIIRCLKHHIGNLNNLTFFIRQVIPFLSPSLFQKYKTKKRTALQTKGLIASWRIAKCKWWL